MSVRRRFTGRRPDWPVPTRVAARCEPDLGKAMLRAFQVGAAAVSRARIAAALTDGDTAAIAQALQPATLAHAIRAEAGPRLVSAFLSGADLGADALRHAGIPVKRDLLGQTKEPLGVSMSAVNPAAVAWARAHAADLVVGDADLQAAIRQLVVRSQARQVTVHDLADEIASMIGLDPRRVAAVAGFADRLREAGVAAREIRQRTDRYAEAQRQARAETIARTETIASLNAGQHELWDQAAGQGLLDRRAMGKQWLASNDDLLCSTCEDLADTIVALDDQFDGGYDAPPAHPSCRCAVGLTPLEDE